LGDPPDVDVVMSEIRIVNTMDRPVATNMRRPNGAAWVVTAVQPGATFTKRTTSGQVRRPSHLAGFTLTTT
jgi:hypothetical protein